MGRETHSRMFVSEGWAMMYGGGLSEMDLYSFASCFMSVSLQSQVDQNRSYPLVGSSTRHFEISPKAETVLSTVEQ